MNDSKEKKSLDPLILEALEKMSNFDEIRGFLFGTRLVRKYFEEDK